MAGGTNTLLLPITSCTISSLGALSPVARCKTFDASADGCADQHTFKQLLSVRRSDRKPMRALTAHM